jgi:CO dehydrogenase/acetyl-CoA synthase gamma subunit (corrinoid Fe-S protein)
MASSITYFVICADFGRKGREAIVDPEMTFRGAVEKVREIIGDGKEIAFAHEVTFMNGSHHVSDVKDELINRANDARLEAAE